MFNAVYLLLPVPGGNAADRSRAPGEVGQPQDRSWLDDRHGQENRVTSNKCTFD